MIRAPLKAVRRWLAAGMLAAVSCHAAAQKTMEITVPQPPGGSVDVMMRSIAPVLAQDLGVSVVIVNRPGASGINGTLSFMNSAPPDGLHLLAGYVGTISINPALYGPRLAYDPTQLVPVSPVAAIPLFLYVNPKLGVKTLAGFVARAKKGDLKFASAGTGGANHLAGELLKLRAGIDMLHVPYSGGAPSQVALLSGSVDALFETGIPMRYVKDGKLDVLAVTSQKRLPEFPSIPTVAETYPGFEVISWHGLFAPKGTPPDTVARLNKAVEKALRDKTVKARFDASQLPPFWLSPGQFKDFIAKEDAKWSQVIRDSGVKIE
ncbi:Bug family tripartite tricarboxylate transporter substrate binding protein [Achromobacter aloeverae]